MDLTRLRLGEKIAGISAIALFLIMFIFTWFDTTYGGVIKLSGNAWQSYGFTDIVLFVTILATAGLIYLSGSRQQLNLNLPVAASAVVVALGALSLILIIISLISPPDVGSHGIVSGSTSRDAGVFLGLIATAALTYGAYLAMQEEGTTLSAEADRLRGRRRGSGSPPPPPSAGTGEAPPPPPPGSGTETGSTPPPPSSGSGRGGPPPSA